MRRDYEAAYEAYHRPENIRRWRRLLGPRGTHILHFFKGLGLRFEREEMDRALKVSRLMPEARAWACVAQDGSPVTYMDYQFWRHFACINNPDYRAYMRRVIDLALGEFEADWLWFDNNILRAEPRSCRCACCRSSSRAT